MNGFLSLSESNLRANARRPKDQWKCRAGDPRARFTRAHPFFLGQRYAALVYMPIYNLDAEELETRTFLSPCDTLERSKWEVWLVFLAAWSLKGAQFTHTRVHLSPFGHSRALVFNSSCLCSHWARKAPRPISFSGPRLAPPRFSGILALISSLSLAESHRKGMAIGRGSEGDRKEIGWSSIS